MPNTGADIEQLTKLGAASAAIGGALVGLSKLRRPPAAGDPPAAPDGDAAD